MLDSAVVYPHRSGGGCGGSRPHGDGEPGGGAVGRGHERSRDRRGDGPRGKHDPLACEAHVRQARAVAAGGSGAACAVAGRRAGERSSFGEDIALVLAAAHIAANLVAQRVVVVTPVADGQQIAILGIEDGQQIAILGIEDEEKPLEQQQGGLAHLRQRRVRLSRGDRTCELRKDLAEDQIGEVSGNALFVETAFFDGALMEGARVGCAWQEGLAPEDQREHLEPVAALRLGEGEQAVVVAGTALLKCSSPSFVPS